MLNNIIISAITFNREGFFKSLDIFWKGLLAILVVIAVVMLVTYLMQFASAKIEEKKKKQYNAEQEANSDGDCEL